MEGDGANANAERTITRQETMVMFARAIGIREEGTPDLSQFADGHTAAAWAAGYLDPLAELGILSGAEDGSLLAPLAQIDRASTMALLDKAISDYVTGSSTVTAEDANRFVVVNAGQTAARSGSVVEVSGETAGLVVASGSAGAKITARDLESGLVKVDAPVALTLSGTSAAGYMSVNADAQLKVESGADIAAPKLEKESVTLLGDDDTLTLTVPVSDQGELAYLEVDHSLEESFPEFTMEAKDQEILDEESGIGASVRYTDTVGEQKREITFNPAATKLLRESADGSPMTFYFSVKDKAGNQFGSMYFVDEEMTVSDVSVPLDTTAPTVAGFEIDGVSVEDGATVNFDEGQEFTSLTVILSEAVEAGDGEMKITIAEEEFGTFVIDEEDPTKLHITVTNHNGNKFVAGEFQFDLAAGVLKDAAGNENEELSYTINFEQNPA